MANESLIFRKGLQANLADPAKCPIKPGAISITIDEPGMYVDLPANASLGHNNPYRVRIGDVITVQTLKELSDLKNISPDDLSDDGVNPLSGKINSYSSSALYYVTGKNMLLKYDVTNEKFIWINDTSSLQESITELTTNLNTLKGRVDTIQNTTLPAIQQTIADEVKDLQDQIDGITGGGSNSISALTQALADEVAAREAGDSDLQEQITELATTAENTYAKAVNVYDKNAIDSKVSTINTNVTNAETNAKTYAKGLDDATRVYVNNQVEAIGQTTSELSGRFASYELKTDAANKLTEAKTYAAGVADAAEEAAIAAAALDAAAKVKVEEDARKAAVKSVADDLSALNADVYRKANTYTQTEVNNLISGVNSTVNGQEARWQAYTDGKIAIEQAARAADIKTVADDLTEHVTSANTTFETKTDATSKLNAAKADATTKANAAEANAKAAAKTYTDDEIAKLDTAYKAADKALTQSITQVDAKFANYSTTTQIEAMHEALEDAIDDAYKNAKSEAIEAAASDAADKVKVEEEARKAAVKSVNDDLTAFKGTVYTTTQVYTKAETDAKIKAVTDVTNGYQAAWEGYTNGKIAQEVIDRNAAIKVVNDALTGHIASATNTFETKTDAAAKLNAAKADATSKANTAEANAKADAKSYTDTEIGKLDTAYKAADKKIADDVTALTGRVGAIEGEIGDPSGGTDKPATGLYKYIDDHDALTLQDAKDYTDSMLQAAEAMKYMGEVSGASDSAIQTALAGKTNVEAGHVYVVASTTNTYHAGDLMIAAKDGSGTDNKLAWSADNWTHVETGYDASLEQKLTATVAANGGSVELDSLGSLDNGSITLKAAADASGNHTSAVRVTMTTTNATNNGHNATVTIGMVWEDF